MDPNKNGGITEPIELSWNFVETEDNLSASIEPNTSRRIWIADVNYLGNAWLMRDVRNLPANYQQIFGPSGTYRAIVQVGDGDALSIETLVEIMGAEGEGDKTYPRGQGKARIAILEQDSPKLTRPATRLPVATKG
ncbi:hypothetical protein JQT66_14900 [Sulfitobacter mediterraneus]|uniref:hypothetical protein n=1 Tax=Sulfitobacter mediterraneus TaxID=83219 RepID=UPI0019324EDA|nr:hypothetical protein [Sulfitobacter mediterraneus]MBM1311530.1 hypothetical protein [Sulfitobacter mediterraneus]MBM1315412.1 hypothetical protein [Sulfitobacter mediterraneus]MBM1323773.1 hypothetical protein [Sulfitobacter mediterraneus]MBM1327685.1 hypothetical protein [Sulfitobacter mediterraneus]MBM1399033.1 hypothetical protein [Sulfitobacter mediterraneus]